MIGLFIIKENSLFEWNYFHKCIRIVFDFYTFFLQFKFFHYKPCNFLALIIQFLNYIWIFVPAVKFIPISFQPVIYFLR